MHALNVAELSVEQEESLVELLCVGGAGTLDWFMLDQRLARLAWELDQVCRRAGRAYSSTSPSSVADCASRSSLSVK